MHSLEMHEFLEKKKWKLLEKITNLDGASHEETKKKDQHQQTAFFNTPC